MTTKALGRPLPGDEAPAAAGDHSDPERGTAPQRPPTEAEIRQAIEVRLQLRAGPNLDEMDELRAGLERIALAAADPMLEPAIAVLDGITGHSGGHGWEPLRADPDGLWRDLRPSEAVLLRDVVAAAAERAAARCEAVIIEELVLAATFFAGAHPEAPRSEYSPPDKD